MKHTSLAHYFDSIRQVVSRKCAACGDCLQVCPVFPTIPSAGEGPQAIAEKVLETVKGGPLSPQAYEMAFSCNGCFLCRGHCPEDLNPDQLTFMARIAIIRQGRGPSIPLQGFRDDPYNVRRLLSALQVEPGEEPWLNEVPVDPRPADVVLFTSCTSHFSPHIISSAIGILKAMKIDFVALGGLRFCCGGADRVRGDFQEAERRGKELVDAIAAFRPRLAISICPGCQDHFLNLLPNVFPVPFRSQHLTQFLAENLDRIPFTRPINKVATIQDSCFLGRLLGEYEAPRKLLRAIPGLRLVEMEHHREHAFCCGVKTGLVFPERGRQMRRRRVQEAHASGAEILVGVCASCHQFMCHEERNFPLEIVSYLTLVGRAMGIDHRDLFKELIFNPNNIPQVVAEKGECWQRAHLEPAEVARHLSSYLEGICPPADAAR